MFDDDTSYGLLKTLENNPGLSQRDLAKHLGISLGKVNFLLNALIRKGLVKVDNFKNSNNKKAYLYYLTPHGAEEKAKTTYFFIKRKTLEYERLKEEISQLQQEVNDLEEQIVSGNEKNA